MRRAIVKVHDERAAVLEELEDRRFRVTYLPGYAGAPVSLAMPLRAEAYDFASFPPYFDGVLPEGGQLDALLRLAKIDASDTMGQLLWVGGDLVGAVTVEALPDEIQSNGDAA